MANLMCVVLSLLLAVSAVRCAPLAPPTFPSVDPALVAAHSDPVMTSVCASMTPGHETSEPQPSPPPYVIDVSPTQASPGDIVHVRVSGVGAEQFKGLYIQGRQGDVPVGQFLHPGEDVPSVALRDCPPGEQNAASYISRKAISELTLDYVVPDVSAVVFRATFVKSFSEFWVGVESQELVVSKSTPAS